MLTQVTDLLHCISTDVCKARIKFICHSFLIFGEDSLCFSMASRDFSPYKQALMPTVTESKFSSQCQKKWRQATKVQEMINKRKLLYLVTNSLNCNIQIRRQENKVCMLPRTKQVFSLSFTLSKWKPLKDTTQWSGYILKHFVRTALRNFTQLLLQLTLINLPRFFLYFWFCTCTSQIEKSWPTKK